MLIYDPAFDPFHCALRVLVALEHSGRSELEIDRARIADYFLLFPAKISYVRLPSAYRFMKTVAKSFENPYRSPPRGKAIFERMHPIFLTATSCLAAAGLIDAELLHSGLVTRTTIPLPADLRAAEERFVSRHKIVREFILNTLLNLPLLGRDGLKDRTGLLEYRYDPV